MRIETELDGKTVGAIERHYFHAREKHPYFCDKLFGWQGHPSQKEFVKEEIECCRRNIVFQTMRHTVCAQLLFDCEYAEMKEALVEGDISQAICECYDAIAVLLRVIDVLEGRQELGKPKGEQK